MKFNDLLRIYYNLLEFEKLAEKEIEKKVR